MAKTNALRLLDQKKIPYRLVTYNYDSENMNVAKIATDNNLELAQIFKTLVCKGDKTGPIVAIIPGDQQLNLKKLAPISNNKKMTLLPLKDLTSTTGYVRGGCSPIGMKKSYPTFVYDTAREWDEILINAGARGLLVGLDAALLIQTFGYSFYNSEQ